MAAAAFPLFSMAATGMASFIHFPQIDFLPLFIAPATVRRNKIHATGLSFRNDAQRNEESILLLYNNFWILRFARNDKIGAIISNLD
jgi:hypothetical protein